MLTKSLARNTYVCAHGGGGDERWRMCRRAGAVCVMIVCATGGSGVCVVG
jgi:hypothetical protein